MPQVYTNHAPISTRSKMLRAALAYARRGVPVFPCTPGGKKPLTQNGFKDATTDQRKITAWWTRWPDANIAIPTGRASGVWILDVDGEKGRTSLARLEAENGPLPATAIVRSGGGGSHYYFEYPTDGTVIKSSCEKLGPGLDVRGEGGYALVPPSVTSGVYVKEAHRG